MTVYLRLNTKDKSNTNAVRLWINTNNGFAQARNIPKHKMNMNMFVKTTTIQLQAYLGLTRIVPLLEVTERKQIIYI